MESQSLSCRMLNQNRIGTKAHGKLGKAWRMIGCIISVSLIYYLADPTLLLASSTQQAMPSTRVTQSLHYHAPNAGEVYLVWGVNGWGVMAEEFRPAGTVIEFGVMNTPMVRDGDTFVAQLQLPIGTALTYGFQTRKTRGGKAISWVWDGDYQQIITPNNRIEMNATVSLPKTHAPPDDAHTPTVLQEFHYYAPEAGEVYLVWGINGWKVAPEPFRPPGTVVEFDVMHTPMVLDRDTFVVQLQVPLGMTLDYGFQTRKKSIGTPIEWIWDGKYQLSPTKNDVIATESAVTLTDAKEYPRDFVSGPHLLMTVSLLLGLALLLKRMLPWTPTTKPLEPSITILSNGASLFLFLLVLRANILGFQWISFYISPRFTPVIFAASYYDLLYISTLTVLFLVLLWMLRTHTKVQRGLILVYFGITFLSLLVGFANVQVVQVLGRPINYQWLYYADFLTSADAHNAIKSNLSAQAIFNGVTLVIGLAALTRLFCVSAQLMPNHPPKRIFFTSTIISLCLYLLLAQQYQHTTEKTYPKLANPIVFFLESLQDTWTQPPLFTLPLYKADFADFQPISGAQDIPPQYQTTGEIHNVVLFVMESVAAEYLEAYGSVYPVMPELNRYRQQMLLFNNIYVGAPASNSSLFSLLSGVYPWISYASLTQVKPEIQVSTLSSELQQLGYRTIFLSASDATFQRGNEFLAHQQFETIQDYNSLDCTRKKIDLEWDYSDAIDEQCLIDAFGQWQSKQPTEPFFAMMWSMGTHYPYFVMDEEIDYGVNDKMLNRYLNALRYTDKVIGQLLRLLAERNLLDSTLVVLVGDHGEAFGHHDQIGHLEKIYEENIHVPLLFINPRLFQGEENHVIGGILDIAPTILPLLNLPTPQVWQGQNLLSPHHRNRAYFFAAMSDFWFGYREANLKFLFNATTNQQEIYDVVADPYETTNLLDQMPTLVPIAQQRLAAWVQYHDRYMKQLVNP